MFWHLQASTMSWHSTISPYRIDRNRVRNTLLPEEFIEVFVDTPLEVCEDRDPNGLYKKARAGELIGFTGIDAPYEPPLSPELVLLAAEKNPDTLANEVIAFLERKEIIGKNIRG